MEKIKVDEYFPLRALYPTLIQFFSVFHKNPIVYLDQRKKLYTMSLHMIIFVSVLVYCSVKQAGDLL